MLPKSNVLDLTNFVIQDYIKFLLFESSKFQCTKYNVVPEIPSDVVCVYTPSS